MYCDGRALIKRELVGKNEFIMILKIWGWNILEEWCCLSM